MKNEIHSIRFSDVTSSPSPLLEKPIIRQRDESEAAFLLRAHYLLFKADRESLLEVDGWEEGEWLIICGFPGMGHDFD